MPYISSSMPRSEDPTQVQFNLHTHERYELYCFLSGDVDFYIEGNGHHLMPGDILIIKKAEAHTMTVKGPAPYHRMVVHFDESDLIGHPEEQERLLHFLNERPLGRNNSFPAADFPDSHWQYYIRCLCEASSIPQKQFYLMVLLHELSCASISAPVRPVRRDIITEVIAYINTNLTQPLSLELLCKHFFFSKAQLNRRFKKVTGTTVWNYIITKRLMLARSLLRSGESPNAACEQSGFQDYCTFFRAYKDRFGLSPSQDFSPD